MNLDAIKAGLTLALLLAAVVCGLGWRHEAREFAEFKARVEQEGKAAKKAAEQENAKHEKARRDTEEEWKSRIGPAQDQAVARYRAAHPGGVWQCAGSSGVPEIAGRSPGADGSGGERLATAHPDETFIRACASDALTVEMWQSWAVANSLPVQ